MRAPALSMLCAALVCGSPLSRAGTEYRNTAPGVRWVGSKACAACHRDIYESFQRTAMGRSMSLAGDPVNLARVPARATVNSSVSGRATEIYRSGSDLYQSEFEKTADGRELFRVTRKLEYAIGSGQNGVSYITADGGFLYEAPLSFFSRANHWEYSPGFEVNDPGFNRPIVAGCTSCHSGQARTNSAANGRYADPAFPELAIGCENCHGPGQIHVRERGREADRQARADSSIVNPARLDTRLAENICIRCHQGGDTAVLQRGKDYSDFRPGQWLADTQAVFKVPQRATGGGAKVLDHFYGMTLSRCFSASKGKLTCTSCHDPHREPAKAEAAAFYRARCLQCHAPADCSLPLETRIRQKPGDDCAGCHMPKRELPQFSHAALTDHRILKNPTLVAESIDAESYLRTTPQLPDLIYLDPAADRKPGALPDRVLLEAYGQLAGSFPQYQARYLEIIASLRGKETNDPVVLSALGRHELAGDDGQANLRAESYLSRAVANGSSDPDTFQALAEAQARLQHLPDAVEVLRKAIVLAPWKESLYKYLAWRLITLKRFAEAKDVLGEGVKRFPEDGFFRKMLEQVQRLPPEAG